jgi:5'-nucleotidase
MLILVDQDGPLADFERAFLDHWQTKYPDEFFIPVDERKTFYIREEYPSHLTKKVDAIYCSPGFYLNLPPTPGCIEAINFLLDSGHDVRICTAPLSRYDNCVLEKYQWVEKHFGRAFTKRVIITKDKTVVRGDLLIDDRPDVEGVYKPVWEHIIFDSSYNRNITDKRRLNWNNFREVLGI